MKHEMETTISFHGLAAKEPLFFDRLARLHNTPSAMLLVTYSKPLSAQPVLLNEHSKTEGAFGMLETCF